MDSSQAIAEIGKGALDALNELLWEVYSVRTPPIGFRYAPSIVCRSECEMFAIAFPRFAVRATFDGGFVNLRRLPRLVECLSEWSDPIAAKPSDKWRDSSDLLFHDTDEASRITIKETIEAQGRYFADSLLMVPSSIGERYHAICTGRLDQAIGETGLGEQELFGVPYVQHIRISGGLCAQAVCFMVAALLHGTGLRIDGIVEISLIRYLQRNPQRKLNWSSQAGIIQSLTNEDLDFPLSGMKATEISTYLMSLGFSAREEGLYNISNFLVQPGAPLNLLRVAVIQNSLRDYLLSGVPVVLLVNVNKLGGFYGRMLKGRLKTPVPSHRAGHAMLLFGATKDRAHASFLCNDPRSLPFQEICAPEIVNAPAGNDFKCIPVLPVGVNVTLLDGHAIGLLSALAFTLNNTDGNTYFERLPPQAREALEELRDSKYTCLKLGDFRLVRKSADGLSVSNGQFEEKNLSRLLNAISNDSTEMRSLSDGHYWVQFLKPIEYEDKDQQCLVWRACKNSEGTSTRESLPQLFVARVKLGSRVRDRSLERDNVKLRSTQSQHTLSNTIDMQSTAARNSLKPSVITSFSCRGVSESIEQLARLNWQGYERLCDLYMLMHEDGILDQHNNARVHMANNAENQTYIDELASKLLSSLDEQSFRVRAFASFIPEISSSSTHLRHEAVKSLVFLGRLANSINLLYQSKQVCAIEIVAGAKTTGIWPAMEKTGSDGLVQVFAASLRSREKSLEILIESMKLVSQELCSLDNCPRFAVELEPGPLYTIAYKNDLEYLVGLLRDHKLSEHIGLNLDVAHWRLSKISTNDLPELVKDAICHSHLSGHFPLGHFGDVQPLIFNQRADFAEWFDFLRMLPAEQFSGVISLEQEAVRDQSYLAQSFDQFLSLLNL